jgi:hypothetical protein
MLTRAERGAGVDLHDVSDALDSARAKTHFIDGALRRLVMMKRARALIQDECSTRSITADVDTVATLGLYVNSFYLNLSGALDKIAWALVHEFSLADDVDEHNRKHQRLAQLASENFVKQLSKVRPRIADRVGLSSSWFSEVKRLRDPAAHRLPLSVVAGVLTQDEVHRVRHLQEQAQEALKADDVDRYVQLLDES